MPVDQEWCGESTWLKPFDPEEEQTGMKEEEYEEAESRRSQQMKRECQKCQIHQAIGWKEEGSMS